ncbi:hypothetical protein [Lysinibacter cavernae]|uniref:hypothetical protein n=1 Tax=Lysinibacter cavernae TaxID=1640652 RepID=UPI0036070B81
MNTSFLTFDPSDNLVMDAPGHSWDILVTQVQLEYRGDQDNPYLSIGIVSGKRYENGIAGSIGATRRIYQSGRNFYPQWVQELINEHAPARELTTSSR